MLIDENKAVELLNGDHIVALPTETVYGLAARFDSESALKKVFQIKKRPSFDPLIVHVSQKSQLEQIATAVTAVESFLMDRFWPGPLTLVLPKKDSVSDIITSGLSTVAVRMPKNQSFLDIIQRTAPLAAPSANLFGHTSPTLASHVEFEFEGKLAVFDGGPCQVGIESTVVQVVESETTIDLYILRPGMLAPTEIISALTAHSPKKIAAHHGATAASPGHVQDHYQPRIPLIVGHTNNPWTSALHNAISAHLQLSAGGNHAELKCSGESPAIVARTLYSDLRRLSASSASYIYLTVDDAFFTEDWRAIRDRVQKAAHWNVNSQTQKLEPKLNSFEKP